VDPSTIALIQQSFADLRAPAIDVAEVFYAELFAVDPSCRPMFGSDMQVQRRKLVSALNYMVHALHAPEQVPGSVRKLAEAHVGYGVTPEHYTSFGIALLRTLKKVLGSEFTPELCDAWATWFQIVARAMKEAAYDHVPEKAMELAWWRGLLIDETPPLALAPA